PLHAQLRSGRHRRLGGQDRVDARLPQPAPWGGEPRSHENRSGAGSSLDQGLHPRVLVRHRGAGPPFWGIDQRRLRRAFLERRPAGGGGPDVDPAGRGAMRVGISCYPTYGGWGIVATELAMALAERGDEVHVISYALPSRLSFINPRIFFHEVVTPTYP